MSGEGPESVPTSADPRSHRPTKKRALTPGSAQAASVDALFAKPDQDIRIPTSSSAVARSNRSAPPEIVTNVQGSSAGAGSGEFHVYKASRRREYERLRQMDDQVRSEKARDEFDRSKDEKMKRDEERTRKNREKRDKMKARKARKGKGGGGDGGVAARPENSTNSIHQPQDAAAGDADGDGNGGSTRANGVDPQNREPSAATAPSVGLVIHDDD